MWEKLVGISKKGRNGYEDNPKRKKRERRVGKNECVYEVMDYKRLTIELQQRVD